MSEGSYSVDEYKKESRKSLGEALMAGQLKMAGLEPFEREYRFAAPVRQWRFDFAWPTYKVALEIEGTVFFGKEKDGSPKKGRHQTAAGLREDCHKYNTAAVNDWIVIRADQKMVKDGAALEYIERTLNMRKIRQTCEERREKSLQDQISALDEAIINIARRVHE